MTVPADPSVASSAAARARRTRRQRIAGPTAGVLLVAVAAAATAWSGTPEGRFSLFGNWSERELTSGGTSDFSQLIATLSMYSPDDTDTRVEYGLDARVATFPSSDRDERVSIYEAFVGLRSTARRWSLRLGQMWVHELGGLGAVGGLQADIRLGDSAVGSWRIGALAGLEPERYEAGYAEDIQKGAGYVVLEGAGGRRHVLGYVRVRNDTLVERSTVVFTNFIPVGRKLFLYQNAEYETEGPAGLGGSELTYLFGNLRWSVTDFLQLQGTYHRGRSIDTRRITEDHLAGRPVAPATLDGFLFESTRFRATVRPWRGIQLWASAGHDTNNRGDEAADRVGFGFSVVGTVLGGFDLTANSHRIDRGGESYNSTYASLGRSFGPRVYVSLDYVTALSVYRYDAVDGGTITVRPESTRYGLSANLNLSRTLTLLLTGELTDHDDFEESRLLSGLVIRF